MFSGQDARLTDSKQSTGGLRVLANVLDKHIFFCPDRCEGLGTVALQTKDGGGGGDSRGHEHVIMAQVRFTVELVAGETKEADVDCKIVSVNVLHED